MKKIDISTPMHPGTFALVDDKDYVALNAHKWHAAELSGKVYAVRNIRDNGTRKKVLMHIAIMGKVEGKMIDHRNRITLDNQRHNLRRCTNAENQRNRGDQANNTSGYKGVVWQPNCNLWQVQINVNRKHIHIGTFFCIIKAAKAYDKASIKYHREFGNLNFPESEQNNERRIQTRQNQVNG